MGRLAAQTTGQIMQSQQSLTVSYVHLFVKNEAHDLNVKACPS